MKTNLLYKHRPNLSSTLLGCLAVMAQGLYAASGTWDGGGSQALNQGIWGGSNNWNPNGAVADGVGFTANFGSAFGNGYACIVNTNRTIGNIVYNDPAAANDFTLGRHASDFNLILDVNTGLPQIDVSQADRTLTINPRIAGTDGLSKIGPGRLVLTNGSMTYTGLTTVEAGTLFLQSPCTLAAGSDVMVNGGTLAGNGTITGNVSVGAAGNVSPGETVGYLTINGNLDLSGQATGTGKMTYDLNSLTVGNDLLLVAGTVEMGAGGLGMNNFNFLNAGGLELGTYKLIVSSGLLGGLDSSDLTGPVANYSFTGTLQLNGNDLELVVSPGTASPYTVWSGGGAFLADANGDGLTNGIAWMLGAQNPAAAGQAVQPSVQVAGNFVVMAFQRIKNLGPAQLAVEYGTALTGWTRVTIPLLGGNLAGGIEAQVTAGATLDQVSLKLPMALASANGRLFARLVATEQGN